MLLCLLKQMDFGVLEWAVLGNVVLLLVLLIVLFYTICRLRKATLQNKLEETLPYSDTSDLVPQRYSTLCGLKTNNNGAGARQQLVGGTTSGMSIFSSGMDPYHDMRRYDKQNRGIVSNFHLEKTTGTGGALGTSAVAPMSPSIIALAPSSGPPAYFSATLPLPGKKATFMKTLPTTAYFAAAPAPYWIALPPPTLAPPTQPTFQYVGTPYTTLPAVFKKHQRCRHEQLLMLKNGQQSGNNNNCGNNNHSSNSGNNHSQNQNGIQGILHSNSSRLRGIDASSPCLVVHNCGKKVQLQEDF